MAKSKMLYSKRTKPPKYSFHIVVKQHYNKKILYITYGGGRKSGGGAWSENITNIHPRTLNMIEEYLGSKAVDDLKKLLTGEYKGKKYEPSSKPTNKPRKPPKQQNK